LDAQNVRPIEIYRPLIAVCEEGVMIEWKVRKWCRMFNDGRTNVHGEERSGRPSLITEDLKNMTDQHIRTNGLHVIFTYSHTWGSFGAPRAWVAMKTLKKTVQDWFDGLEADF
jgi:hypothetical protein